MHYPWKLVGTKSRYEYACDNADEKMNGDKLCSLQAQDFDGKGK